MKSINAMSQAELAAYVQSHLRCRGIPSKDIDLVNAQFAGPKKIENAMMEIGFSRVGRHFEHPETDQIVEFPPGPLAIGNEIVKEVSQIEFNTGVLNVLSPTDCVKDRLAHFYHWGDRQCFAQAILVAQNHRVDLLEIREWSQREGKLSEFNIIADHLDAK